MNSCEQLAGLASVRIRSLLSRYRKNSPKIDDGPQHWALAGSFLESTPGKRGIIGLPSRGCAYARTDWGGCAVCGHSASTLWKANAQTHDILSDVKRALSELSTHRPSTVCLYCSGSFLDDTELHPDVRNFILTELSSYSWVKEVIIESLPALITSERIHSLLRQMPGINISIGMGLDTSNDFLRSFCYQRHIPAEHYRRAIKVCSDAAIPTTAYIVYKPPFLSAEEAVYDSAKSVLDAFDIGFSAVSIEPVAMQAGTLQEALARFDFYTPATLWSMASIFKQCGRLCDFESYVPRLRVGGQVFTPLPYSTLTGCSSCLKTINDLLPILKGRILNSLPLCEHNARCGMPGFVEAREVSVPDLLARTNHILDAIEPLLDNFDRLRYHVEYATSN